MTRLAFRRHVVECDSVEWLANLPREDQEIYAIVRIKDLWHHRDEEFRPAGDRFVCEFFLLTLSPGEPIADRDLIKWWEMGGFGVSERVWRQSGNNELELLYQAYGEDRTFADELTYCN